MDRTQREAASALRGFARLSAEEREIMARKGGQAAHAKGVAHRFEKGAAATREAGRRGGRARWDSDEPKESKP